MFPVQIIRTCNIHGTTPKHGDWGGNGPKHGLCAMVHALAWCLIFRSGSKAKGDACTPVALPGCCQDTMQGMETRLVSWFVPTCPLSPAKPDVLKTVLRKGTVTKLTTPNRWQGNIYQKHRFLFIRVEQGLNDFLIMCYGREAVCWNLRRNDRPNRQFIQLTRFCLTAHTLVAPPS